MKVHVRPKNREGKAEENINHIHVYIDIQLRNVFAIVFLN